MSLHSRPVFAPFGDDREPEAERGSASFALFLRCKKTARVRVAADLFGGQPRLFKKIREEDVPAAWAEVTNAEDRSEDFANLARELERLVAQRAPADQPVPESQGGHTDRAHGGDATSAPPTGST